MNTPLYKVRHIENIRDLLLGSANLFSNLPAFKVKNEKESYDIITYADLNDLVTALGTKLIDIGLKNKRIAIISENRYEWCISYLATVNGTGIVVPLDKALTNIEIERLLERSEAECVIFSSKYKEIMADIKTRNKFLKHYILMDKEKNSDYLSLDELIESGKNLLVSGNREYIDATIDNDAMSIILFTSGTTADSKAVMLSHHNICSDIMATCSTVKVKSSDVLLSFLPLHHTYECTIGFLIPIYRGASIVHCEGLKHIVKNLKESSATVMVCVPLLFENMHKKIMEHAEKEGKLKSLKTAMKINHFLLNSLKLNISKLLFKPVYANFGGKMRLFICGASAVNPQVAKDFNDIGIKFLQGYGLTETSPLVTGCTDKHIRYNSPGRPIPGVEVKIDNPNEEGIGEIAAKGPNVMLGYYNNPEATKEAIRDGWFYTGDLGYLDTDGSLVITGRKKSVIVLKNGKNVFPEELETLLNREEFVKESFVWGKTDKGGDTIVSAKIIPNFDMIKEKFGNLSDLQIKEKIQGVVKAINSKMPSYKAIREWKIAAEELIKTTTQKIKRHEELKKIEKEEENKK
jgi:long-chain acyl-CoA synthetase